MKPDVHFGDSRLKVTRVFNAPRSLVYSWWSYAERLQQWSGCKEAVSCRVTMDFRIGGSFTQEMQISVNGGTCRLRITATYEQIVIPERIVYHAHINGIPTRVTVNFFEDGEATTVVLVHEGLPNEIFEANIFQGTSESFDKLDCLISSRGFVRVR